MCGFETFTNGKFSDTNGKCENEKSRQKFEGTEKVPFENIGDKILG
jgi:hypothetical protein